jgi:hypothetical protein
MNANHIQALVDGMNAQSMRYRAAAQMTLGTLIEQLQAMPPDALIDGIRDPHSYRGYYSDLAFERGAEKVKASDALAMCRDCMGRVFEGYKGGDFVMGALTPVWIAHYGSCGEKILALDCATGALSTGPDEY